MLYKNVGNHVEDLADGRALAPGESADLDEDAVRDPRNEDLVARGVLIGTDEEAEHEADLAERRVKTRATRADKAREEGDDA